jgi:ESS family glutamate:Na+ symporter
VASYCGSGGLCDASTSACFCAVGFWHDAHTWGKAVCVEKPPAASNVTAFVSLFLLLFLGKMTRMYTPLQKLYLPSSVIAGVYGLIVVQILSNASSDSNVFLRRHVIPGWANQPGFLITVAFAAMYLGVEIPPVRKVLKTSGAALNYGVVAAMVQWLVALLVAGCVCAPLFGSNPMIALIVPLGFAGGAGTAVGLGPSMKKHGFAEGGDLALASSCVGLLISVILGMAMVNFAARKGWAKESRMKTATNKLSLQGINAMDNRPVAGFQTVSADSIDVLAWHLTVLALAMGIGWSFQSLIALVGGPDLPLFVLSMIGGIMIQRFLQAFNTETKLVDATLMSRISGTAIDVLVVTAMATLEIGAVAENIWPFLVLMVTGVLAQIFCIFYISPWMSPSHFFEHGIAVFGQQTGVVAVALILLRAVDPEGKTPVPQQFSYKQLIHSLLFGGGIFTSLAVPLLAAIGVWWFSLLCACLLVSLLALNGLYCRKKVFPELRREAAEYAEEGCDDAAPGGQESADCLDAGDLGVEGLLGGENSSGEYYNPPAQ